ncbi:MAG TPA: GNAT family protein [Pyrinomonadaceae bacterium]|nr:GNAT family protein [Pyrinomonadaceae bacterium]
MNIKGKRILVRAIEREDVPTLHAWFNDPELTAQLTETHFPSSLLQQEAWLERIQKDESSIRLAVQTDDAALIGYTGFWNIDWRDRRAEHAVVIGDQTQRGQGYGQEVIVTCARYAFHEMGLHRLEASILETNEASLKAYKSCGFQVEGVLREHALRGGQRVNKIILGLLATEYRNH